MPSPLIPGLQGPFKKGRPTLVASATPPLENGAPTDVHPRPFGYAPARLCGRRRAEGCDSGGARCAHQGAHGCLDVFFTANVFGCGRRCAALPKLAPLPPTPYLLPVPHHTRARAHTGTPFTRAPITGRVSTSSTTRQSPSRTTSTSRATRPTKSRPGSVPRWGEERPPTFFGRGTVYVCVCVCACVEGVGRGESGGTRRPAVRAASPCLQGGAGGLNGHVILCVICHCARRKQASPRRGGACVRAWC